MRARLVFVCFVVWPAQQRGHATRRFLNGNDVRACVFACLLLPCLP